MPSHAELTLTNSHEIYHYLKRSYTLICCIEFPRFASDHYSLVFINIVYQKALIYVRYLENLLGKNLVYTLELSQKVHFSTLNYTDKIGHPAIVVFLKEI